MDTYNLDTTDKRQELNVTKYIANKNKYDSTMVDALQTLISNKKKKKKGIEKTTKKQNGLPSPMLEKNLTI
jgi:hypothetical protein